MTAQNIIDRAWEILQDTEPTKRTPTAAMVPLVNAALRDLLARRPGLYLDSDGARETFTATTTSTLTTSLFVPDQYLEPLAAFVAARVFSLDADDEHNAALAQQNMQTYLQEA